MKHFIPFLTSPRCKPLKKREHGNVLILIMLAVAMFAALTYAVSDGMRGGGSTVTKEQARVAAGEIIRRGAAIENAVNYMMTNNGCSESELEFWHEYYLNIDDSSMESTMSNDDSTRDECDIYNPNGGGLSPEYASSSAITDGGSLPVTNGKPGHWAAAIIVNIDNVGSDLNDFAIVTPSISRAVCEAINKQVGINTLYYGIDHDYFAFYGSNNNLNTVLTSVLGDAETDLSGKRTFCFNTRASGSTEAPDSYWFVHVIYAR